MKSIRFIVASLALCFATGVLVISLASSVPSVYSASDKFRTNDKQFYLSGDILPDHVLYPVVMVADKIKLETASPTDRIYLHTTYANLRLEYAQKLLEKENCELALTTLTKSQKYLLRAITENQTLKPNPELQRHLLKTIQYHLDQHHKLKTYFNNNEQDLINQLDAEIMVFVDELKTELDL